MALVLKDRVRVTSSTTGTGTFTLGTVASGYQDFSVIGDGNTTYYAIQNSGDNTWEVGIGTYTASGTTLSRDTVLESSNSGSLVNFAAGTKDVFVTYPAEKGLYLDASGNAIGLGTPASATLTNATGLPLTTGVTGTLPIANGGTNLTTYTQGDIVYASATNTLGKLSDVATGNALISGGVGADPLWGKIGLTTHVSGTLPVANGGTGITSFGTGVATFLGNPSSSNLASAVTDETGTGSLVFATSPTLVTPVLGTPTSVTLTNATGLPLTTGVTGTLPVANGGTGTSTAFTAGSVVFAGASGVYSQNNAGFFWDNTNSRLGIGTTPSVKLDIYDATSSVLSVDGDSNTSIRITRYSTDSTAPALNFRKARGTKSSPTTVATGDFTVNLQAFAHDGTTFRTTATISSQVETYTTTDNLSGNLIFYTRPTGVAATTLERMRIDSAGNVGIGTTSPFTYGLSIAKTTGNNAGVRIVSGTSISDIVMNDGGGLYITNGSATLPTMFYLNSAERMRIDSAGNVGIGTTSMNGRLNSTPKSTFNAGSTTWAESAYSANGTFGGGYSLIDGTAGYLLNAQDFGATFSIRQGTVGSSPTEIMRTTSAGLLQFNSGYGSVATAYGCRAWISFNGSGTIAIRGSGNVSSIADNGTGQYTINLSTAMPDTNFCTVASGGNTPDGADTIANAVFINSSSIKMRAHNSAAGQIDPTTMSCAVFR